jgi:hypothetical protein
MDALARSAPTSKEILVIQVYGPLQAGYLRILRIFCEYVAYFANLCGVLCVFNRPEYGPWMMASSAVWAAPRYS